MIKRFGLVLATALAILVFSPSSKAADLFLAVVVHDLDGPVGAGLFRDRRRPYTVPNPAAGTFNITNLIVTQTTISGSSVGAINTYGAYSGGVYNANNQGVQGFIWNGSVPTQFFRDGGTLTNGSNFYLTGGGGFDRLGFFASVTARQGSWGFDTGNLTLQAVTTPVPEPSTWAMGVIGTCVAAVIARRRKARKN